MTPPRLAIVVPCYNEQEVLPHTMQTLGALITRMSREGLVASDSYILYVDDCSRDTTWRLIEKYHSENPILAKGIRFAHNRGQQNALLAGLLTAGESCDCAVTIDADLQDPPEAIIEMLKKYEEGAEIVFGVRSSRDTDTWFKRTSARAFYRFQQALGVETIYDHSEFRLMSARAIHMLAQYGESNMFLRGTVIGLGLDTAIVKTPRMARQAGETKYSLGKMLSLSIDGITSFTAAPMRVIFMVGLAILILDIIVAIWALFSYVHGTTASGWTSLILSVWFLGGLILMCVGIVGEYIGKIYTEVKRRPRYAIRDRLM